MSFENLPAELEQGVQRYATSCHISHDEAVFKLIEVGLQHFPIPTPEDASNRAVEPRSRGKKQGPQVPRRTSQPGRAIGMFADSPQLVDRILQVVEDRAEYYAGEK